MISNWTQRRRLRVGRPGTRSKPTQKISKMTGGRQVGKSDSRLIWKRKTKGSPCYFEESWNQMEQWPSVGWSGSKRKVHPTSVSLCSHIFTTSFSWKVVFPLLLFVVCCCITCRTVDMRMAPPAGKTAVAIVVVATQNVARGHFLFFFFFVGY